LKEFIEATNRAKSVDELFELYKKAMAELGFDRLIFSLMTDHVIIGRRAGHGIARNYPEDWMEFYVERNYEVIDPVRHKIYTAPGVFTWQSLLDLRRVTKTQVGLFEQAKDAGLRDGVGVPLRGPRGAIAGIGAASSAGGVSLDKNTLSRAYLLSQQFYTAFLALEKAPEDTPPIMLTDREQEVLKWCALGKTKAEIAEIMRLPERTIRFYMTRIQRKLDVNSTAAAILKALNMGLIQV
jgi:DNA-binding CsgD family transcriptional regulator